MEKRILKSYYGGATMVYAILVMLASAFGWLAMKSKQVDETVESWINEYTITRKETK
jgi:hypothetical protein